MRRSLLFSLALTFIASAGAAPAVEPDAMGRRGDATNDDRVNLADVIKIVGHLFKGYTAPPCLNQADANDDGAVDITDAVYLNGWLFRGGPPPPPPGPVNPSCQPDPTPPHLGCETPSCP